ncbi:MAG: bifunctional phosphopantothenoylcysteine decarboxylase/phosphopantothenate--cysteine ligase CoaBC [Bacteroidota bacterium]
MRGKKIILGVTGSIAAYKAAYLVRLLVKSGAEVKVVMTHSAKDFITPITLSTLSKNPCYIDFVNGANGEWNNHVELALWADFMLIAPASANTIGKMANGLCDNLLLATYLSGRCPVYIAPAMDEDMWKHPSTKKNMETLASFGNIIIQPQDGELASGLMGEGRMDEPENILAFLQKELDKTRLLMNKKVLVTAGPTYESIDPVRFIGNHSSGKMGFAIAEELARQGAEVTLISGPTSMEINNPDINLIKIVSAEEMYKACLNSFKTADITVMAAAVADYSPSEQSSKKIKKKVQKIEIKLSPTKDILYELGKLKNKKQFLCGFALETENGIDNAKLKLKRKNLDMIVLNSLSDVGAGFQTSTNKISIINSSNKIINFGLKDKKQVAVDIVNHIINNYK